MRFLVNALIALMILGLLSGMVYQRNLQQQQQQRLDDVRDNVRRLSREIMLQATLRRVELTDAGYPATVDPNWFEDDLPQNSLLGAAHPWLEIAHEDHRRLEHPPDRVAADTSVARFWYNPYNGRVRARVPFAMSDASTLKLYNYINDANLGALFEDDAADSLLLR